MTDIFLLGSFHFLEYDYGYYTSAVQDKLRKMVDEIALFKPDTIAVEAALRVQIDIDECYNRLDIESFNSSDIMKSGTLGNIAIFNQTVPVTYNNEAVQIAFRLGKLLGHKKIYAVDDDTIPEMVDADEISDEVKAMLNGAYSALNNSSYFSLFDYLEYVNTSEWSDINQHTYMLLNSVGACESYTGVKYTSKWYERNLRIFANIQKLCSTSKRMFILYGAGHLKLLREFIRYTDNMRLTDISEYINWR